ncbi:glycoside hydrolase family 2 TIM barrel-domain containing protein [Novosphingobium sp. ERW19]|uniref:glycoside hydrolase family 2 TIM barrel-domain containing protein n=1 Tax=Novosphingobium sp. ERW19 TaxID=2726186 RepID=UPI001F109E24|nr:glycoside hydrolase family 2 TIM barrel-domain containing protein [Novosphingobium sp. ERW19]
MGHRKWMFGVSLALLAQPMHAAQAQTSLQPAAQATPAEVRKITVLADGWRFRKGGADAVDPRLDDSTWEQIQVPHSWNRVGTYDPAANVPGMAGRKIDDYMGEGWYRLSFSAPQARPDGRLWLEFGAASRTAEVWLNGTRLGAHTGGFSTFRFDATSVVKPGANMLVVKVDNSQPAAGGPTASAIPLVGDFFVQGGLYRPVKLIETAGAHFALDDFGGPGIYARTETIGSGKAEVSILGRLANQSARTTEGTIVVRALAADGSIAAEASQPIRLEAGASCESKLALTISSPRLWQGMRDPYLYSLEAELRDRRGKVLDRLRQPLGIRQFTIDPDKGFAINGEHVQLHGVGYHQDDMEQGWAMSSARTAERFATIRDMGANTIRLTHYQHGPDIHNLADRAGVVLWDEIGLVTAWTLDPKQGDAPPDIRAQARQQLLELIRQNYNHPSVAVWSVANEVDFGPNRPGFLGDSGRKITPADPTPFLKDLALVVSKEDPQRHSTLATCCEREDTSEAPIVATAVDVVGANRYFGWYYGKASDLGRNLDFLHARRPRQPQAISEYGAGGALSLHTDNPLGGPIDAGGRVQPEEYQSWIHEQSWPQIAARQHVWASWLWNSFDFGTLTRKEGDALSINTKGLISFDGAVRKDAFYYYRAQWSADPTVHVNGRRYVNRALPVTDVRVYSNAPSTELFLNGRSLGMRADCNNRICVWPEVHLDAGENRVEAVGQFASTKVSDSLSWQLEPARLNAFRIDSGNILTEQGWGSDSFFVNGRAGSADRRSRGRPVVLALIETTELRDQLATYREGTFAYRIPVGPGRYQVTLRFIEPSAQPGERVFTVTANGRPALVKLDIAAVANKALAPVIRTFSIDVASGPLHLEFTPEKGQAIVSALEIVPVSAPVMK